MHSKEANDISKIIDAMGKADFGVKLDYYIKSILPFDMSCIFLFSLDYSPILVHDGYTETVSRTALKAYLRGGYLLDPFYVASIHNHPDGIWRMRELAPDSFFTSDFMLSKEVHPCVSTEEGSLAEEIGFILHLNKKTTAVYSLMRNSDRNCFSKKELVQLKDLLPLIYSSILQHCENNLLAKNSLNYKKIKSMEDAFIHAFDSKLTNSQCLVVKMMLRGHSTISIANEMNITEGTVKLHKSNIYVRLRLSNQTELFRQFIDYIIAT